MSWPVAVDAITESVVTTLGPDGRWNVAALGLFPGEPVTARTWGRTRTRRNFRERGEGYVQFTRDPRDFVDAAVGVRTEDDPVLASADAWVRVAVSAVDEGVEGETGWVEWTLEPVESEIRREVVPSTTRGYAAVVEATVAASRLDVPGYDRDELVAGLEYFADVVDRTGNARDREAFARLRRRCDW